MNYVCFIMEVEEVEPNVFEYLLIERIWDEAAKVYEYYNSELLCQTQPFESILEYKTTVDCGVEKPNDPQDCLWMVEADKPIDIAHDGLKHIQKHYYGMINTNPEDDVECWYVGESDRMPGAVWADTEQTNVTHIRGFIIVGCDCYPGTPEERRTAIRTMIYDHLKEDKKRFVYDRDSELLFFKE